MKRTKQILAIIGIVILVGMYVTTLILAIMNNELSNRFFMASIICTVVVPVLIYIYQWLYKLVKKAADDSREGVYIQDDAPEAGPGSAGKEAAGEGSADSADPADSGDSSEPRR